MSFYNPDDQRLMVGDVLNLRDMGGMPLKDGKYFRSNILLRSGSPTFSTPEAINKLRVLGVKTVIDLRSEAELEHYGNPFREDKVTKFYNISLFVGDPDADEDPMMEFLRTHPLGDFYCIMLRELGDRIADVLRVIMNTDELLLFHCAHGKDRTGVIAAILYLLAGADREDIVTNYKVSYDYARYILDPIIEAREEQMRHTLRSDESNMRIFLRYVDDNYDGDIRNFLLSAGLSSDEISKLRYKLIE